MQGSFMHQHKLKFYSLMQGTTDHAPN
jgi:hypothetical protein